jgi:hypothetical protein
MTANKAWCVLINHRLLAGESPVLVTWRAAYHFVAQEVQLGLMRRCRHSLFQLSFLPPHQPLIR